MTPKEIEEEMRSTAMSIVNAFDLEFDDDDLQNFYAMLVGVPADPDLVLVVDEEGRLKDKPVNMVASEIALQPLVGDVVMMERKQLE